MNLATNQLRQLMLGLQHVAMEFPTLFWGSDSMIRLVGGWWFGCRFLMFPIYWVSNHPNWRTHIYQRGGWTTNQIWWFHVQRFVFHSHGMNMAWMCNRHSTDLNYESMIGYPQIPCFISFINVYRFLSCFIRFYDILVVVFRGRSILGYRTNPQKM